MSRLPFAESDPPGRGGGGGPAGRSGSPDRSGRSPAGSRGAAGRGVSQTQKPLTVSAVSLLIKDLLAQVMPGKVRVTGEVSNLRDRQHWFFDLKDDAAVLHCVCFASNVRRITRAVEDGMEVIATGRLDYFDAQGKLQLYVDSMEPVGLGTLEQRYRQQVEKLKAEGYFDPEHKRPLPRMARRIAIVTSRSAAALQDVINTAHRRWPGIQLTLADVRVQGEGAAEQVARAIHDISSQHQKLRIDAIIVTRGGGSIEDLWAFNEQVVADAIYQCRLPVVAAIGHETDTTIAELVADHRCATPTQAAMMLVPDRDALMQQIDQLASRIRVLSQRHLTQLQQQLRALARHPALARPGAVIDIHRTQLQQFKQTLLKSATAKLRHEQQHVMALSQRTVLSQPEVLLNPARQQLARQQHRLIEASHRLHDHRQAHVHALSRQLRAVGPRAVLERGYSMTLDDAGKAVRRAAQVRVGQTITNVLADGRIRSTVQGQGEREGEGNRPRQGRQDSGHAVKREGRPAGKQEGKVKPKADRRRGSRDSQGPGLFDSPTA